MRKSWIIWASLSAAIFVLPAVSWAQFTETQKGTGVGALLGAGTGAIVGAAVHHPIAGTLIGAGVGGVGGYAVGHELQQQQNMNYANRRAIISQQRQIEEQRREIQQLQQIQDTE
jgi:phage tail tape-measure protein